MHSISYLIFFFHFILFHNFLVDANLPLLCADLAVNREGYMILGSFAYFDAFRCVPSRFLETSVYHPAICKYCNQHQYIEVAPNVLAFGRWTHWNTWQMGYKPSCHVIYRQAFELFLQAHHHLFLAKFGLLQSSSYSCHSSHPHLHLESWPKESKSSFKTGWMNAILCSVGSNSGSSNKPLGILKVPTYIIYERIRSVIDILRVCR